MSSILRQMEKIEKVPYLQTRSSFSMEMENTFQENLIAAKSLLAKMPKIYLKLAILKKNQAHSLLSIDSPTRKSVMMTYKFPWLRM
jgi:hypothetical protein